MTYIEGFLTPVPTASRDAYSAHAASAAPILHDMGVVRIVECWGDDVPRGKLNDMWGAVNAAEDETVVFSWFEYPDRATRNAAVEKMMNDPRMEEMGRSMPFDGRRMIWGGFASVSDQGDANGTGYVDGVVMPVPAADHQAFAEFARGVASMFTENGATRVMDALGDDVKAGKLTDFQRAVRLEEGETVGYGWVEWPDKATRDAGWERIMADPRMQERVPPFDGKRMIFGGFVPILDGKGEA